MSTVIRRCTCKHAYQDRVHGNGMRVKNQVVTTKDTPPKYRCTVCGKTE